MAENPIQHSDIIEIDKTIAGIKGIIKQLQQLQKTIKDTARTLVTFQKGQNIATPGGRQATQQTAADIEKLVQKHKKLEISKRDLTKEQVRLTEERRKTRLALKQEIQLEQSAVGSLNRMRAEYNKLTQQYNNANSALRKKLVPQMQKLDGQIKKNEQAIGKHQRNVGNYPKILGKAKQAMLAFGAGVVGATALISGMSRAIKNSISVVLNFDQAMADVQAITRASHEEIGMLRNAAKALGGTTKFTASEVAALQKELGKLGFTVSEILAGTGGILALAAATGEDLARSAEVAGSTIRAFGLNATETRRIVDVMARSFTGSALTLERFAVSMRSVAPVAKAFGFTVEETTALLGSLANAGFDASMAGTATRNILLNLADTSGALAKELGGAVTTFDQFIPALIKLREEGIDLNTVLELTDKRSVAAFSRFLEGAEFTREFADELRNAAGAAEEMAEIQLNTLKGDLIILKSAFQGLIIETKDADDTMNDAARGGIQVVTKGLVAMKNEVADSDTIWDKFRKTILRTIAPTGLPQLIDILKLVKKDTDLVTESVDELSTAELELLEIDRLKAEQAAIKAANELAEIARNERLLTLAQQRAEHYKNFVIPAEQSLNESMNAKEETGLNILNVIDELRSGEENLDNAEIQRANNILNADQKYTDQSIKNLGEKNEAEKESAMFSQKISLGESIVALAQGIANTAKAGFPINIPLLIGYFAQIATVIGTIKSVKFAEGGHGELGGERHSGGGTYLPGIGEAERGEYFGIINRQMTQRYRNDLPAIFDSLNAGKFHDVWSNANIQLQTEIDPWTKKMYDLMMNTPSIYTDSGGDTVKEYHSGRKQIIRHG